MTPSKGKDFEVMVVGGGPAGLSAALVLGRCRRKVLVCDDGRYRNDGSQALHCFLGQDGIVPGELLERSRAQLQRYDTLTFSDATVAGLTPQGGGFIATFQDKSVSSARAVLIATGMVDERPPLKGLDPLFGRSVHVCPYCDGWEHRDAPVAVYGRGEKGAAYATLLRQWTHDLVLCTDGQPLGESIKARLNAHGISIREEPIEALEAKDGCLSAVRFRAGDALPRRALFFTTGQLSAVAIAGCDRLYARS